MVLLFTAISLFVLSKSMSAYNDSQAIQDPIKEIIEELKSKPLTTKVPSFDRTQADAQPKTTEAAAKMFTILLYDMDKSGLLSNTYKHRYRIIREINGEIIGKDTKWYPVPSSYFWQNESNMGMEVAARDSTGKISRVVTPPGYTNIIGNTRYGNWKDPAQASAPLTSTTAKNANKMDYWRFTEQHKHVPKLLQLPTGKIYKKDHTTARDYHNRNIVYYGVTGLYGRKRYGTYSNQYTSYNRGKTWTRRRTSYGK